jgi:Xaa-Pro aminopeptidase
MGIMFVPNPGEHNLRTIMPGDTWVPEPGMVFHMLLCGPGMVGHSEMVVVTDQSHEVLTTLERRLFVKA